MKTEYGWTGKILRVDLTERRWSVEPTERYAERFIGGIGIGFKIFWDEVSADVGAFDPENRLILAPGPLTGTLAPGSGRFELVSKSPRSYPKETVTRSGMGGFWGSELKYAGYDALVIHGRADTWINLWIHDDTVEFRDAGEYLGEDTYSTQIRFRKELDHRAKILCIGPAGENLSRLATILSETSFASGMSGFGAVMGSKNLKAIGVRGKNPLRIADPERLVEVSKTVRKLSEGHVTREYGTRVLNEKEQKEFINRYRKRNTGCFGCPVQCFAYLDVPDAGQSAVHCVSYFYHSPSTRYYGHSLERDQAVSDGYVLTNRYGLDAFAIRNIVSLLKDLHEAGHIQAQPELPLDKIGSREFIQKLTESIATRRGIGDLFAEGGARAADRIKGGWEFASRYYPAQGSEAHGSVRNQPGIALQWALDSRDPIIDQHAYRRLSVSYQNDPQPYTLTLKHARAISRTLFGSEEAIDHSTFGYKPEAVVWAQNRSMVIDILVLCDWVFPVICSFGMGDRTGDTSLESQLFSAVTGYDITEEQLNTAGERVWNLGRAIMVQEGRTRDQDTLHESYFTARNGERAVPRKDFEDAKTRYYQLRGWNESTGLPTREKLDQLGLSDVAADLVL